MKTTKIIAIVLASVFSLSAFAQIATPNIEKRQANQQKRIAYGAASGELTAKETVNLEKREAKIEADKSAAKADGVVTKAERTKLQAQENRVSKRIHEKRHNAHKAQ